MENKYHVRQLENIKKIKIQVPGSKSITNRALLIAALSARRCVLHGVLFSDDSRALLECLKGLGFEVEADEKSMSVVIQGMGGKIPNPKATVNVRSAGTAARFLTVMLALAGGEYELQASPQMCRRPMQPLLEELEKAGVNFEFLGEKWHFPFVMKSQTVTLKEVTIDTKISSQFASALLMSGILLRDGLNVTLQGDRAESPYIKMTVSMMRQFGIRVVQKGRSYDIPHMSNFGLSDYQVEPDVSGACYFYAMAPLLKMDVMVENVHIDSCQGDIKFLKTLQDMGCSLFDQGEGIWISGSSLSGYPGVDISMRDFSDQTMTLAALAPFAEGPTLIRDIGHIRFQESDRIAAIMTELGRMGIECREVPEADGIQIIPGDIKECEIETYEDHRMAMAFSLIGLKTGKITIKNPQCCRKTFENFFEIIEGLYEG